MATLLYELGRFAYRRRIIVLLIWVAALGAGGFAAAKLSAPMSTTFTMPGTESQRALDLLSQRMPGTGTGDAAARVVYLAGPGVKVTDPAATAAVQRSVEEIKKLPLVRSATDPFATKVVSPDGRAALSSVAYSVAAAALTPADKERLFAAGRSVTSAGLHVEFGGDAVLENTAPGATEGLGLAVAAIVLLLTFGSLLAAGLPLLTAIVGVGSGVVGIQIATRFFDLSQGTVSLSIMLGLAVAIDYALFIVSRHRHELIRGRSGPDAAGRALGTAGSAVVFAGATVVVALVALSVVGIPFLTAMGLAAGGTVAISVLIALTLVPALLGFMGERVLGRRGRAARDSESDDTTDAEATGGPITFGERYVRTVVRRRVPVLLSIVLGLGVLAVPAFDLRLGMPDDGVAGHDTTRRKAYDALADAFGPGFSGPLVVVADLSGAGDRKAALATVEKDLAAVPGIATTTPAMPNPAGDTALMTVVPSSGPTEAATETLVKTIRSDALDWRRATGASVYVTGLTAMGIDISARLDEALVPYLAVVIGIAFVLLTLVFRSLVVPLKATVGFLLSIAATFGVVVAVVQWGWLGALFGMDRPSPVLSFLPIFLIGILFGLAMDYEVFLVTRMREEHIHGLDSTASVVHGYRHGARIVAAAGIIMFSVFAGFILGEDPVMKSMGLALSAGILLDAFVVRMTAVPAVMSLLGERAWALPRWLDRVLPDVDVEGAKLAQRLSAEEAAARPVEAGTTSTGEQKGEEIGEQAPSEESGGEDGRLEGVAAEAGSGAH